MVKKMDARLLIPCKSHVNLKALEGVLSFHEIYPAFGRKGLGRVGEVETRLEAIQRLGLNLPA